MVSQKLLRRLARALLPPVVADGVRLLVGPAATDYDTLEAYGTFTEALAHSDSFSHPDIVALVATRTEKYREALARGPIPIALGERILQNLFVLSYIAGQRPIEILELGGACGATFFALNRFLPGTIQAWSVVEVPETAEAGRRAFQDDRLKFFDDIEAAVEGVKHRDLLMTQGGLQCVESPLSTLARLLARSFGYVYVTRLEVSDDLERPVVVRLLDRLSANGPGPVPVELVDRDTSYPATIFPSATIFAAIPDTYRIAFTFEESMPRTKRLGHQTVTTRKMGMLLEKKDSGGHFAAKGVAV